jgi:hypothetical protein
MFTLTRIRRKANKQPRCYYYVPHNINLSVDNILTRRIWDRSSTDSKAIPLQALTGSEGSRRLRLPNFKTIGT